MKSKSHNIFVLVAICLLGSQSLSNSAWGESNAATFPGGEQYSWAHIEWKKSAQDKKFVQARQQIEAVSKKKQSLQPLIKANDKPYELRDSLVQFRWAYARYEAARKTNFKSQDIGDVVTRLTNANLISIPQNAEYSRLMFLLYARASPGDPYTTDMGVRLAKKFPKDFELKWFTLQSMDTGRHPKYMNVGLTYARELLRQQPNKPGARFLIPTLYRNRWYTSWLAVDGRRAVSAYQQAIAGLPPTDPNYKYGMSEIKSIRKMQPVLEKRWNRRSRQPKPWE